MKALTCPQCGALIKNVSEHKRMTSCVYCGAHILITRDVSHFTEKLKKDVLPNENIKKSGTNALWSSPFSDPNAYNESFEKTQKPIISFAGAITIFITGFFVFIVIAIGVSSKREAEPVRTLYPTPSPYKAPTPPIIPVIVFPTPLPNQSVPSEENVSSEETSSLFDISYRVSWDSSIPEQHIELPTLKDADFPSEDLKTLQKTVFAQKIVRVKVKINTNGEVTNAKAVSGHEILKEAAENAARASYFAERKKPLNTVMIYYFQIKQIE